MLYLWGSIHTRPRAVFCSIHTAIHSSSQPANNNNNPTGERIRLARRPLFSFHMCVCVRAFAATYIPDAAIANHYASRVRTDAAIVRE